MTYLHTSNKLVSPFNSGIHIQNSNFTVEEVGQLFRDFAKDHDIQIDNNIIQDIFNKTNGYVINSIDMDTALSLVKAIRDSSACVGVQFKKI